MEVIALIAAVITLCNSLLDFYERRKERNNQDLPDSKDKDDLGNFR